MTVQLYQDQTRQYFEQKINTTSEKQLLEDKGKFFDQCISEVRRFYIPKKKSRVEECRDQMFKFYRLSFSVHRDFLKKDPPIDQLEREALTFYLSCIRRHNKIE